MDDMAKYQLAAAVAAIPPASYLQTALFLKSRLPRKAGDVTICTQCSLDRLDRLEAQTGCWSGVLCVAVMSFCPCTTATLKLAANTIRALHARVESLGGPCRLDIVLVHHSRRTPRLCIVPERTVQPCNGSWQYPINALRNVALCYATTELVILLDVDFIPGRGIQEELWNKDVYLGYFRACTELQKFIVLPALELADDLHSYRAEVMTTTIHRVVQTVSAGKVKVSKMWREKELRTFASDVFPCGHGPTDTERWTSSSSMYEVQYAEGYEPYFLCSRRLVPWYDERLCGYGRNKVIHAFHCALLEFRFWVHPWWFVVHISHAPSTAWEATLGADPLATERLLAIKTLYEAMKSELVLYPSHTGVCLAPGVCTYETTSHESHDNVLSLSIRSRACKCREMMGHWSCADEPSPAALQCWTQEYIMTLYNLRYHFKPVQLIPRPDSGGVLLSKLQRGLRDITLVTVVTPDRLPRLVALSRLWKGVLCAAVYDPRSAELGALQKHLIELHMNVEQAGTCRLDLVLLQSVQEVKLNCCCQAPGIRPFCKRSGCGQYPVDELCPINTMRNAALKLAQTDLVFILDVDLLPSPSLNELMSEQQYKCLWRVAMQEKCCFVVPSFESSHDSLELCGTNGHPLSYGPPSQASKLGSEAFEDPIIAISEEWARRGCSLIGRGLESGEVSGFHVKRYPDGHGPTNFKLWKELSVSDSEQCKICCKVCQSYTIQYREGFEPFVICARNMIPRFDERFRGYGYDKVIFFYQLYLSGFTFKVLLNAYAWNIPHPGSSDWMMTFGQNADSAQKIRVKALYHRAKRELLIRNQVRSSESSVGNLPGQPSGSTGNHWLGSISIVGTNQKIFTTGSSIRDTMNLGLGELQLCWKGSLSALGSAHNSGLVHDEGACNTSQALKTAETISERPLFNVKEKQEGVMAESSKISHKSCHSIWFQVICVGCFKKNKSTCSSDGARWNLKSLDVAEKYGSKRVEEFEWDSTSWELRSKVESLANCCVVRVPSEIAGDEDLISAGSFLLRVSMSAGSWSPQASHAAGITGGGICVRSFLQIKLQEKAVFRYMLKFPSSFQWVKGGTLPGLWLDDILKLTLGWRKAGKGIVLLNFPDQTKGKVIELPRSFQQDPPRPFFFVPGQWHALQLAISLVRGDFSGLNLGTNEIQDISEENRQTGTGSLRSVQLQAFFDHELVYNNTSKVSVDELRLPYVGLMMSCFFGGKSKEWATPEDTHIDFNKFEVWTTKGVS